MERGASTTTIRWDRDWARRLASLFGKARLQSPGVASSRFGTARAEGYFLAVASGKGGTGKSFFATNLAVALAARRRVTLVDCDFGLANDHLLLGVNPTRSVQHFFAGAASLAEIRTPTPFGPMLLPGGSGISQLGDLTELELMRLGTGLSSIAGDADVMLMDAAAGISPQSVLTLLAAQHVLIITNPEIAALTDAYALIKCLASHPHPGDVSVVVNRVTSIAQGEATYRKLAEVSRRFSRCEIHYMGSIPEEPAVTQHRLNQPPLIVSDPACDASRSILAILARLEQHLGPLASRVVAAADTVEERFRRHLGRSRPRR